VGLSQKKVPSTICFTRGVIGGSFFRDLRGTSEDKVSSKCILVRLTPRLDELASFTAPPLISNLNFYRNENPMKLSATLMCILLSSASFAAQNQPPTPAPGQQQPGPTPQVPIFEKARVKVNIYKITIERVGDEFKDRREEVCTKSIPLDVFDTRHVVGGNLPLSTVECDSTFENKPIKLNAWLFASVYRISNNQNTSYQDSKGYYASLTSSGSDQSNPQNLPTFPSGTSIRTKDLGLKSLIYDIAPMSGIICIEQGGSEIPVPKPIASANLLSQNTDTDTTCTIAFPVSFGATIEFESL
jgi:hypothetical protein